MFQLGFPIRACFCYALEMREQTEHICRLCDQQKELCQSHIIPEFLYKGLYSPAKSRLHEIRLSRDANKSKVIFHQLGLRERLLCAECESYLSDFETHLSEAYFKSPNRFMIAPQIIEYRDLDYRKARLFQHSLLWRMAITSIPLFGKIDLRRKDRNALKALLKSGSPGEPHQYPVLSKIDLSAGGFSEFIGMPLVENLRPRHRKCKASKKFQRIYLMFVGHLWIWDVDGSGEDILQGAAVKTLVGRDGVWWSVVESFRGTDFYEKLQADFRRLPEHILNKVQ